MIRNTKKTNRNLLIGILGSFIFLVVFLIFYTILSRENRKDIIVRQVSDFIIQKQELLSSYVVNSKYSTPEANKFGTSYSIPELKKLEHEQVTLFFYENDSLRSWTNNDVVFVPEIFDSNLFSSPVVSLKSGFYLSCIKKDSNVTVLGLALIKRVFGIKNIYLEDYFTKGINLSSETDVILSKTKYSIYSKSGNFLFSLNLPQRIPNIEKNVFILFIIFILFIFFFIQTLYYVLFSIIKRSPELLNTVFLFLVFLLRIILYSFQIPSSFYPSDLFQEHFSVLPSLGNMFLHIWFFLSVYFCYNKANISCSYKPKRKYDFFAAIFFSIFSCVSVFIYLLLIEYLVEFTNIYDSFDNVSKFNTGSILALIMIFVMSFLLFSGFNKIISKVYYYSRSTTSCILLFFVGVLLCGAMWFHFKYVYTGLFFSITLFILYLVSFFRNWNLKSFSQLLLIVIIFSAFPSYQILKLQDHKEKANRKILAEKLCTETNPAIRSFFNEFRKVFPKDQTLQKMLILGIDSDSIRNYLKEEHSNDIWNYYDVASTSYFDFYNANAGTITNTGFGIDSLAKKMKKEIIKTEMHGLYAMIDDLGNTVYYSEALEFNNTYGKLYMFLRFSKRTYLKPNQYSCLVMSGAFEKVNFEDYSYAKYINDSLIEDGGEYIYPERMSLKADSIKQIMSKNNKQLEFRNLNHYEHLMYIRPQSPISLVISKHLPSFYDKLKIFSCMFILFSLVIFIFIFLNYLVYSSKLQKNNFKTSVQISIIFLVITSFIILGTVSIYYINKVTNQKSKEIFQEHANTIVFALEYNRQNINGFQQQRTGKASQVGDELNNLKKELLRYFDIYGEDVTIFNCSGKIIASSSPEIYDLGVFSPLMHPTAIKTLSDNEHYSILEVGNNIGKDYKITYASIKNVHNEILGYISIPHFTVKNLQAEFVNFLTTCINIAALVILLLFCLLIFITNMITKPLLAIRKQLEKYTIGGKKMIWESNDEIGALVNEYNRMIEKLQENSYLAAKMERENGWREMTRQVAHEIKNPLTPMRLSVQQLIKTWNDKVPDFDSRLRQTSQVLIEQIDILSRIANTFLDFSKMPHSASEKVDIIECINSVIDLYRDDSLLTYTFDTILQDCYVIGDKQQLVRVFGNLFRNVEQAIPPERRGEMNISVEKWQKSYVIRFTDNGKGIPDSEKHLIFHPHFTTKEDGTGLGLSIVKSIIESFGGSIDFESVVDEGTTFVIYLPIIE